MTIHLNIGKEENHPEVTPASRHLLNLKSVDGSKKDSARANVTVDLKEEIRSKNNEMPGRICIVGERPRHRAGLGRAPMIVAAVLVIFVLNLGQLVFLGKSEGSEALALAGEAVASLTQAGSSLVSGETGGERVFLTEAGEKFAKAEQEAAFLLSHQSEWLGEPAQVKSLRNLLEIGKMIASTGNHLSLAREALLALPETGSLTDYLAQVSAEHFEPAAAEIDQIQLLMSEVDLTGTPYVDQFSEFKSTINRMDEMLQLWLDAKDPLLTILGSRYPQHYLVLFMNNDEMRPGGGFIGKIALIELNDGRLTKKEFHDVYEFDNRFYDELPVPIHELEGLTDFWRLRDSNTSPDFPTSAKQAMWLFDQEGGTSVDGVFAVNLSAAQHLLEITGPVELPSYKTPLDAKTFPVVMSTLVEAKVAGAQPKSVLTEFIESFLGKLNADPVQKSKVGLALLDEMKKKQVMFYHEDEAVQKLLSSMDLDGSLPQFSTVEGDFFMPIFTDIAGNKTERYMQTSIEHATSFYQDGAIVNAVTVRRSHTFGTEALNWMKRESAKFGFTAWNKDLESLLGSGINRAGIRLYFPEGVRILDVTGNLYRDDLQFKYDSAQDISYYYVDQSIPAGQSASFTVYYALPWVKDGNFEEYSFQWFKQPGMKQVSYIKTVKAPEDTMLSSHPLPTRREEGFDYISEGSLDQDMFFKLLYR